MSNRERAPSFFASPPRPGENSLMAMAVASRRPSSTPPPRRASSQVSLSAQGLESSSVFSPSKLSSLGESKVKQEQRKLNIKVPNPPAVSADDANRDNWHGLPASPRLPRSPVGSKAPASPRSRQRRTSTVHQLTQPTEAFLGRSKYAKAHATARPFAVIEEGFLMDTLLKWVAKYSVEPEPMEPFPEKLFVETGKPASTAMSPNLKQNTSRKEAFADYERKKIVFESKLVASRYAQFLHRALSGFRFSQHRSLTSLLEIVHTLEHYIHDKWKDLQWQRNLDYNSKTSARQTLCQAELVLICLTCLTELELLFNIVIKLADRIEESSRYWKSLDGSHWRYSIVTFGEAFTRNASGNRDPDGRVHSIAERLDFLNSKLVAYMVILGQAKRLMREVYDIAHHDIDLSRKYEELMDWAIRSFELVESHLDLMQQSREDADDGLEAAGLHRNLDIVDLLDILEKMQRNAANATSEKASPSPFLGPIIVRHVKDAVKRVPVFYANHLAEFHHLQKPGRLQRFWPEFLLGSLVFVGGCVWAKRSVTRNDIVRSLDRLKRSAAEFISEHVTEPAEALYREVFLDQYIEVTDPLEVEDSKLSLQRCLREYLVQKELKRLDEGSIVGMFSTREESELPKSVRLEIDKKARAMKMSDVMRDYENELIQPKSNLLMGNIVQLMLIQMQFMKKEMMVAMGKMDTVLKANHFNMEAMALVPAFFVAGITYNLAKKVVRRLTIDDKGRRDTRSELQITLRDIDQSLNHVAHKSSIDDSGYEAYRMELHELGNLALLLHRFDEQLNIYFKFGNVRPEIRYRLEEDLEELMMEEFSLAQRIRVVERIFRSYEVFQPVSRRNFRF